jgi:hypothetical protein
MTDYVGLLFREGSENSRAPGGYGLSRIWEKVKAG